MILTEATYASIELEAGRTVEVETGHENPLARVGGQLARLQVPVVEKPAALEVVRAGAEAATNRSRGVADSDGDVEIFRNLRDVFVQNIHVAGLCYQTPAISVKLHLRDGRTDGLSVRPSVRLLDGV